MIQNTVSSWVFEKQSKLLTRGRGFDIGTVDQGL